MCLQTVTNEWGEIFMKQSANNSDKLTSVIFAYFLLYTDDSSENGFSYIAIYFFFFFFFFFPSNTASKEHLWPSLFFSQGTC